MDIKDEHMLMLKGVLTPSMVIELSELCFPFLKGGNSAIIAAIANGKEIKWDLITKT